MSIGQIDRQIDEGRVPVLVHVEFVDVAQVAFEVINPQKTCPTTINCVSRHRVRKIRKKQTIVCPPRRSRTPKVSGLGGTAHG